MVTVFDLAIKELKDRVSFLTGGLANGAAKDHAEYKHMCGEIQGLNRACDILTDLVRKAEQNDE